MTVLGFIFSILKQLPLCFTNVAILASSYDRLPLPVPHGWWCFSPLKLSLAQSSTISFQCLKEVADLISFSHQMSPDSSDSSAVRSSFS